MSQPTEDKSKRQGLYTLEFLDWAIRSAPVRKPRLVLVLMALVRHANKQGRCWPSHKRLAQIVYDVEMPTDDQREQVRKALRELESLGLITSGWNPLTERTIYALQVQATPVQSTGVTPVESTGDPRPVNGVPPSSQRGYPRRVNGREQPREQPEEQPEEQRSEQTAPPLRVVAGWDSNPTTCGSTDSLARLRQRAASDWGRVRH